MRGTGTCFTPLPRADGKGGVLMLREGYPMAISLLSGKSYLTGRAKVIDLPSQMAEALGMSYTSYRVTLHHMRSNVKRFREWAMKPRKLLRCRI